MRLLRFGYLALAAFCVLDAVAIVVSYWYIVLGGGGSPFVWFIISLVCVYFMMRTAAQAWEKGRTTA